MVDFIVIVIILAIVGLAAAYVIKARKSGRKCIGCPEGSCSGHCGEGCSCCGHDKKGS